MSWFAPSRHPNEPLLQVMESSKWLMLVHQIPPDPSYLRVKVRRRLHRIGSISLKSTVYVLPNSESAREDFEWLGQEIRSDGGEAVLCETRFISGVLDEDVRDLFREERDAEYAAIARQVREIGTGGSDAALSAQIHREKRRLATVVKLDFFDASGRAEAEGAIADAEARITGSLQPVADASPLPLEDLRRRIWVTRRGVHVDRMASAWLIKRFIDPDARFRFVDPDNYQHTAGEVRYDMYDAEFTHEGDRCTFEVLSALAAPEDSALEALAEIVHDIDLRDGKFGRTEAAGIERLVAGIQTAHSSDSDRLARAAEVFEGLYRSFGGAI